MARKNNANKIPLKMHNEEDTARISEELQRATAARDSAKSNDEKIAAARKFEEVKLRQKEVFIFSRYICNSQEFIY